MFYPLCLNNQNIFPLFGDFLQGKPAIIDLSDNNPDVSVFDTQNFIAFNRQIDEEMKKAGARWGVAKYLEKRSTILRHYPEIINEKRVFHAGLDIITPYNTPLFAPLDAEVYAIGKEKELGLYGGYICLKHRVGGAVFYSFYGHLKTPQEVEVRQEIKAGESFAFLGKESDSGGWFSHLHLQILTQKAIDEGHLLTGYITPAMLQQVESLFPSPYFLFGF